MDHEKSTGAPVRPVVSIWETGVDREVVVGVRVHEAWSDGVEAFRRLPVALLEFWTEFAGPAANRIGVKEGKAPALVLFPDLKLRFFFEDAHQNRRFLRHVLAFDLGHHAVRQRLHMPAADSRRAVRVATGKR